MATKAKPPVVKKVVKKKKPVVDVFELDYSGIVDAAERKFHLTLGSMDIEARRNTFVSTGLLMEDILLGGGILPGGWYTFFGGEGAAKSTNTMRLVGNSIDIDVPIVALFDFEGSSDPSYIESMFEASGIKINIQELFGVKNDKTGGWAIKPRVRYYSPDTAEKFFSSVSSILRSLPSKVYLNNQWWLVFDNTVPNRKKVGDKFSKQLFSEYNKFYVPDPTNGRMQALFIVDSYPAMLSEKEDDDDAGGQGLGAQARMFAENIRKIKSKLKSRACTVIGTNQLRLRPMARFQNPEYEPGGEALKFFCPHEDTLMFTDKGIIKAKHWPAVAPKYLLGAEGKEIPSHFDYMGKHPIAKVETYMGFEVLGRHEHKVLAVKQGSTEYKWVPIRDLTNEYYVAIKTNSNLWSNKKLNLDFNLQLKGGQGSNQHQVEPVFPKHVTSELARLLGYLVGEGHVRDGRVIFSNTDIDICEDYIKCLKKVFGFSKEYLVRKEKTFKPKGKTGKGEDYSKQYISDIYSTQLGSFLCYLGVSNKSSREKTIPWCILQSPKEIVAEFIKALFDGEGSPSEKELNISSSSQELIKQVQLVLLNFGIVGRRVNGKANWFDKEFNFSNKYSSLNLYANDMDKFYQVIGFTSKRKLNILKNKIDSSRESIYNYLPPMFSYWEIKKRLALDLQKELRYDVIPGTTNGKRGYKASDFTNKVYKNINSLINNYRTVQEREASWSKLHEIRNLAEYTKQNSLIWSKVSDVQCNLEPANVYDWNMPITHTIVTDGIVSHNSDCRVKQTPRSVPHGKGPIEEEDSVMIDGGIDKYRYIHMKAIKNKLATPYLEGWFRLCVTNAEGKSTGFDVVWDTFQYLRATGQVTGSMDKLKIMLPNFENKIRLSWADFKGLILFKGADMKAHCKDLKYKENPRIREQCVRQMKSGKGMELYFETMAAKSASDEGEE